MENKKINFCPKCGNKLEGSEKFCNKCGYNLLEETKGTLPPQQKKIEAAIPQTQVIEKKSNGKSKKILIGIGVIAVIIILIYK